jgi:uncharacterized protein YqgV (UPF0045/DUF77 family)
VGHDGLQSGVRHNAARIYTTLKINTHTDRDQTLEDKVASVEALLQELPERCQ